MEPSYIDEFDKNYMYRIIFTDDSDFEFVIRNSSNGYYNG